MGQGNTGQTGLGGMIGGELGLAFDPYGAAMDQYQKYFHQAGQFQNPFYRAGTAALPQYQSYLQGMRDPMAYIEHLMSGYKESPSALALARSALRGGENAASASGLLGSTPFAQQMAQTSADITAQDQNRWLQNVLGAGSQYGMGLSNLLGRGQMAGNALTGLYSNLGQLMGQGSYGQQAAREAAWGDIIGGQMQRQQEQQQQGGGWGDVIASAVPLIGSVLSSLL